MTQPLTVRLHLDPGLRASAEAGEHNFIGLMVTVLQQAGYDVRFHDNSPADRALSAAQPGYALFHMEPVLGPNTLTFRRVYHYPFWTIEQSEKRWEWRVARAAFDPDQVPRARADTFYHRWQTRLFQDQCRHASRDGFVYVPLQGRLLDHRSFQSCSPLGMLEHVLTHDRTRRVVATLHPKESYSRVDLTALEQLADQHTRLTIETGQMERWLRGCDYVVTQNSSAAFAGYFFGKPAAVFAKIDFAHIAADVTKIGVEQALRIVPDMAPDYAGYVHWFWQKQAINAGRSDAMDRIARKFKRAGWPMDRPEPAAPEAD